MASLFINTNPIKKDIPINKELELIKERLKLDPISILKMIRNVFEHDYEFRDVPFKRYRHKNHFICNCIKEISRETIPLQLDIWKQLIPADYYDNKEKLRLLKTLCQHTQNILIDNRPTFELYPEIYNHSSFDKYGFIFSSWWIYYNNNEMLWETALEQRIKYLNLLMEKLRAD